MAVRYFDLNGSTAGFGTLTGAWNTTSAFWSTSSAGTATPAAYTFTNADSANFGFAGTTATAGTATVADGVTVTLNNITTANLAGLQTITRTTSGALTIAGTTPRITVNSAGGLTISAPLGGTTAWTSNGSGTLTLTAANGFSAGMTVASGVVQVGNNSALGTGTITMTGGRLSSSSTTAYSLSNALSLNGTMTLGDATNSGQLTFGGTTSVAGTTTLTVNSAVIFSGALSGSVGFTKTGTAPLYLNGVSGYLGTATISGSSSVVVGADGGASGFWRGAVTINSDASLVANNYNMFGYSTNASAPSVTINAGGTLTNFVNPYLTTVGPLTLAGGTLTSGAQQVVVGVISGAYILRGGVTATDNSTISGYPVAMGSDTSPTGTVNVASGKTLTISANLVNTPNTAFTAAQTTNLAQQTGTGTLTLSGTNTFTGAVSVSAGTLNANSATALGAVSSTAAITVTSGATLSLGAATSYASRTTTISGTGVSTGGALVHNYAGTANVGSITLGAAAYVRGTATGTLSSSFANGGFALTVGAASGSTLSLTGGISGTGGLTVGGNALDYGAVSLAASNTYTGNTTISTSGTTIVSAAEVAGTSGPLGAKTSSGSLLMLGGYLKYTATNSYDYSDRFSVAGGQSWNIDVNGQSVTFSAQLVGTSSLSVSSSVGSGTLTIANAMNTYSGGTLVEGYATLAFSSANAIRGGSVTMAGGTLKWLSGNTGGIADKLVFLGGTNTFDIGSSNGVLFGASFGSDANSSVVVTGTTAGNAVFSQANTFTGSFTANSVTVRATNATALGPINGGAITVQSGGTLNLDVSVNYSSRVLTISNSALLLSVATGSPTYSFSSVLCSVGTPKIFGYTGTLVGNIAMGGGASSVLFGAYAGSTDPFVIAGNLSGATPIVVGQNPDIISTNYFGTVRFNGTNNCGNVSITNYSTAQAGNMQAFGTTGTVTLAPDGGAGSSSTVLQTLTAGGQNGKLTVAGLTNTAGGTIKIGG